MTHNNKIYGHLQAFQVKSNLKQFRIGKTLCLSLRFIKIYKNNVHLRFVARSEINTNYGSVYPLSLIFSKKNVLMKCSTTTHPLGESVFESKKDWMNKDDNVNVIICLRKFYDASRFEMVLESNLVVNGEYMKRNLSRFQRMDPQMATFFYKYNDPCPYCQLCFARACRLFVGQCKTELTIRSRIVVFIKKKIPK